MWSLQTSSGQRKIVCGCEVMKCCYIHQWWCAYAVEPLYFVHPFQAAALHQYWYIQIPFTDFATFQRKIVSQVQPQNSATGSAFYLEEIGQSTFQHKMAPHDPRCSVDQHAWAIFILLRIYNFVQTTNVRPPIPNKQSQSSYLVAHSTLPHCRQCFIFDAQSLMNNYLSWRSCS